MGKIWGDFSPKIYGFWHDGIGKLGLGFCIIVTITLQCVCGSFPLKDSYLIDCGSPNIMTTGDNFCHWHVFFYLNIPNSILASTSSNSVPALLQTAYIFTQPFYSFLIQKHGKHFIHLHFFPLVCQSYNPMASSTSISSSSSNGAPDPSPPMGWLQQKERGMGSSHIMATWSPPFLPKKSNPSPNPWRVLWNIVYEVMSHDNHGF